jgi:hypothetical protein
MSKLLVESGPKIPVGNWKLYACGILTHYGPIGTAGATAFDKVVINPEDLDRVLEVLNVESQGE